MCLTDLAAGGEMTLKPTMFIVLICCDTKFKKLYGEIFHSDGNKPTTRKISVLTLNGRHAPVIPLDIPYLTLPSPLSLSLSLSLLFSLCPLIPLFPLILGECSVPPQRRQMGLNIIQRVSKRERENRGRLHSLFTSLGIGILMLKAIGQPFIKLTGDVGKETRGWGGRMGSEGWRQRQWERGERERGEHTLLNGP